MHESDAYGVRSHQYHELEALRLLSVYPLLATALAVGFAMRLLLVLNRLRTEPSVKSPLSPTSVADRLKILQVSLSVPPPSTFALPTVRVVLRRAACSLAVKPFRKPAAVLYGL